MKRAILLILCLMLCVGCSHNYVRTEYIRQNIPELPVEPEYYSVQWEKKEGSYCVSPENAKKLLKNIELMKGYQKELRLILEELNGTRDN